MPLKTYRNLNGKRKAAVLKISYEEFTLNSYRTASVTNIVKRLTLAKGSFYRYFRNKLELYTYLVERAHELRLKQMGDLLSNDGLDFFEMLRENYRNKIVFDIHYPLESILLFNLYQENDAGEVQKLRKKIIGEEIIFIKELILRFQKKGDLNPYVDPEIAAQFIFQTQTGIYDYLGFFRGIDFKENIRSGIRIFNLSEGEIMEVADQFLMIIMLGLEKKQV